MDIQTRWSVGFVRIYQWARIRPKIPRLPTLVRLAMLAGVAGAASAGLFGCSPPDSKATPPAPSVTVSRPISREVMEWDEYSGHLESPESVNLQAQVSGELVDTPFDEGSIVQKGKVLFVIDDRLFKAQLESRQADVAKAESQEALANTQLKRFAELRRLNSVSEQDYDNVAASYKQARAVLMGAQAAAKSAALNVEWTKVTAPIAGRVGRKNVTVGNQVTGTAGQGTLLTTIQSMDPMYCYIDVNEQAILKYGRLAREKKRVSARDARIPTFLELANEVGFPHAGVVDFVDNKVTTGTGTLIGRGIFANPDGALVPGFFGRVVLPGSGAYQAMLVPDAAVQTDQDSKYVLVVKADETAEVRPVKLGALFGKLRALEEGVSESDRVIVKGIQLVRPGSKVVAAEVPISADALRMVLPIPPATLPSVGGAPAPAPASTRPATMPVAAGPQGMGVPR